MRDAYGYSIPTSKVNAVLKKLIKALGAETVLDQLSEALTTNELADALAFICRQNNIDIARLGNKSIHDAGEPLKMPDENRKGLPGMGTPASGGVKYKGFLVIPVEEGGMDIYDQEYWSVCGVGYQTPQEAKAAIDSFVEQYGDPGSAGVNAAKQIATYKAPRCRIFEYDDGTFELKIGGEAGDKYTAERTRDLIAVFNDLIDHGILTESDILHKNTAKIDPKIIDRIYDLWVDEFYPVDPLDEDDKFDTDKDLEIEKITENDEEF